MLCAGCVPCSLTFSGTFPPLGSKTVLSGLNAAPSLTLFVCSSSRSPTSLLYPGKGVSAVFPCIMSILCALSLFAASGTSPSHTLRRRTQLPGATEAEPIQPEVTYSQWGASHTATLTTRPTRLGGLGLGRSDGGVFYDVRNGCLLSALHFIACTPSLFPGA